MSYLRAAYNSRVILQALRELLRTRKHSRQAQKNRAAYCPDSLRRRAWVSLLVITSLVERSHDDLEGSRLGSGAHEGLRRFEFRRKLRDLRHVARVDTDRLAGREGSVQLRLDPGDDRSRVGPGRGEAEHARAAGLHGLVGRGNRAARVVEHQDRTLGVQVAVGVADVIERAPDVAESDRGGIGGIGGEKNRGHSGVSFRDVRGLIASTVYIIAHRAGKSRLLLSRVCKLFVKLPALSLLLFPALFMLLI